MTEQMLEWAPFLSHLQSHHKFILKRVIVKKTKDLVMSSKQIANITMLLFITVLFTGRPYVTWNLPFVLRCIKTCHFSLVHTVRDLAPLTQTLSLHLPQF